MSAAMRARRPLGDWVVGAIHGLCAAALIGALCFAGCAPEREAKHVGPSCPAEVPNAPCSPRATWDVYAVGFNEFEEQQLRDGAAMWEVASGGAVRFEWSRHDGAIDIRKGPIEEGSFLGITRARAHIVIDADAISPDVGLAGVAAHELGHVMGLNHSSDAAALMAPTVHPCMRVTDDDMGALYNALSAELLRAEL